MGLERDGSRHEYPWLPLTQGVLLHLHPGTTVSETQQPMLWSKQGGTLPSPSGVSALSREPLKSLLMLEQVAMATPEGKTG